ncbi:MAG: hypothetical protein U0M13_12075 [Desulfovibrio fairfieldensis]|nr:hypothetical protein [Desulfovibrio fairfieldensis]
MTLIIFFTKEKKTSARLSPTFGYNTTTLLIHYSLLERFHFGIALAAARADARHERLPLAAMPPCG